MTPAPRKPTPELPPPCRYTLGDGICGTPATHQLPVSLASNSEPLPLCGVHAPRFLGAAEPLA